MKNLKYLVLLFFLLIFLPLQADSVFLKAILSGAAYYPEYPDYDYDSPVLGSNIRADIFNIVTELGIGGNVFYKIKSYDEHFQNLRRYDAYLHNFVNYRKDKSYFLYGFFVGIRYTNLEYTNRKTKIDGELSMTRPLIGFHFSTEKWGMSLSWTQAENRKPILGYEVKFLSLNGLVLQIGRSNRGSLSDVGSELHIYAGYEFFID
jgi:hypothetical protein